MANNNEISFTHTITSRNVRILTFVALNNLVCIMRYDEQSIT
jgi:hypothetical protein